MEMIVGGKKVSKAKTLKVYNPYSGEIVDDVPDGDINDVENAINSAIEGKKIMKDLPLHKRVEILENVSTLLLEREKELSETIVKEVGKTIKEAKNEVIRTSELFRYAAEEAKRIHGETLPFSSLKGSEHKRGYYVLEPIGIVGAITPFNVPLSLAAHKVAPAIAAGNAVILKPATQTPLNALILGELLLEAGMPEKALSVLTGRGSIVGNAIVKDPRIRFLSFTGSVETGEYICQNAGMKKIGLELGSNSALIVMDSADLDKATQATVDGGFSLAGQVCISVQRVFIQEKVYEEFINKLVEKTKRIILGDPMDEKTTMGPVIDEQNAQRIVEWIQEAEVKGGKIVTGGKRNYTLIEPTIVIDTPLETKIMQNELFGPAVALRKIKSLQEAIDLTNRSIYGLQAGVFTEKISEAFKAAEEIEAGGVMINEGPRYRADFMPYGGYKKSGIGREGIKFAIEEMSEMKVICFDLKE
ncbi:aldehyde dehydrogenase family protein [Petrotoga sp. 9PWA.NaAc.5.4]|uniref:aldehyde dehydrogenase family protein n=1 Tax=Petrotoga sp. 9PWA.NaAc.5.4 TaxID=1434328 RepID=UPI000CBBECB4|nr:aldehyde dehydrogenase family protein [Petrotoga sp. 9PWA.NaAc.5.4]PNR96765.1 aldehyde dehydrogenase [Petrotoga sp. 9PWA.NaAc.5.4]